MLKRSFLFVLPVASAFFISSASFAATVYPAGGSASLSISGPGVRTTEVIFPDEIPGIFNAESRGVGGASLIEISFSREFEIAGVGSEYYMLDLKTFPSGTGTYTIPIPAEPSPKLSAGMNVMYRLSSTNGVVTVDDTTTSSCPGSKGSITISHFPDVGGNVEGSFEATLCDGAHHSSLAVSGTFKVKRQR